MAKIGKFLRRANDISISYFLSSAASLIDMKLHNIFKKPYNARIYRWRDTALLNFLEREFKCVIDEWADKEETAQPFLDMRDAPYWTCWLQGQDDMPDIIRYLTKRAATLSGSHKLTVITLENLSSYVEIDSKIISLFKTGKIGAAHFSDVIRFALLSKFGGVWLDSSLLLTESIPDSIFENPFWGIKGRELDFEYGKICFAADEWTIFFQAAQPHSLLYGFMQEILNQYYSEFDYVCEYLLAGYFLSIARTRIKAVASEYQKIPENNTQCEKLWGIIADDGSFTDISQAEKLKHSETYIFKLSYKVPYASAENVSNTIMTLDRMYPIKS